MIGRYLFRKKIYFLLAFILDAIGYPIAFLLRLARVAPASFPKNILLVRLDHLGDALGASGIPSLIKKQFPQTRVTFLTASLGAAVLANNPFVDEIIIYDAPWFSRKKGERDKGIHFAELSRLLRGKGFDAAVVLRGDLRENFLTWKAGIPRRVGFGVTGGGFFLNNEIAYRVGVHESEHAIDALRALGLLETRPANAIYFSSEEEAAFSKKMEAWGMVEGRWIGFQLDAGASSKNWPEQNIRLLMKKFAERFPQKQMVLVGADGAMSERLMGFAAQEKLASTFLSLAGKTSPRELFFVLKHLEAFIGPDSGPAHVAASMGVPTLFLYSGTNVFEEWKPLSAAASVLRQAVACAPCYRTSCNVSGHPCMADIQPESVLDWLEQKMGNP